MEFALDAHFPPSLFHLDAQLINQFTNAMRAFLFLGILETFTTGVGVASVHHGDRIGEGAFGRERFVHKGLFEGSLGMKTVDSHSEMVRVVVFQNGHAVGTLCLDKVLAQLDGSVKDVEGWLRRSMQFGSLVIAVGRTLTTASSFGSLVSRFVATLYTCLGFVAVCRNGRQGRDRGTSHWRHWGSGHGNVVVASGTRIVGGRLDLELRNKVG